MQTAFKFLRAFLILSILIFPIASFSETKVPEGFEDLLEGQDLWVEAMLYGEPLGMLKISVQLDTLQILDQDLLFQKFKKITNLDKTQLSKLKTRLSEPFIRNTNLSCSSSGNSAGCDYLQSDFLDVIYDENNSKLLLFTSPDFLVKSDDGDAYYRTSEGLQNAFIHQQNVAFVSDRNYQNVSFQGNGTLGITESGFANVDWTLQGQHYRSESNQTLDLNNAYYRQDFLKSVYVQAGLMDSRDIFSSNGGGINLSQLPIGRIKGVRTGSSTVWMNPAKQSQGSPITVLLSRDSRVDAYRNNQLLTSFYLKSGVQQIDTRTFPSGSYMVTLRIYEDNSLVRSEDTAFSKSGDNGINSFQWFMQTGTQDTQRTPAQSDDPQIFQAGLRVPLTAFSSLTAGSALMKNGQFFEGAADWSHAFSSFMVDGLLTTRFSYLYGSEGSRGNIQQVSYNDGFSLSFYRNAMTSDNCDSRQKMSLSYSGCYKSISAMLSVPVSQWYVTAGYSLSSNQGRYVYRNQLQDFNSNSGAPWEQVFVTRSVSKTWQSGLNRAFTFSGINLNTSINAFVRNDSGFTSSDRGGFISFSLSFVQPASPEGKRSSASLGANYQSSKRNASQMNVNAGYSQLLDESGENEIGASLSGASSQGVSASLYGRTGGASGAGSLTLSNTYDRSRSSNSLSASGNYSSSLLADRSGFSLGRWGNGVPAAAVLVRVDSTYEDDTSPVNVSLDNGAATDVRANSRSALTLSGYQSVAMKIVESTDISSGVVSEIYKGAGTASVFLPPGKVYSRNISVRPRYTWMGRLKDSSNRTLANIIPLNVRSWSSGENGALNFETDSPVTKLYLMKGETFMVCPLRVKAVRDVIRWLGVTTCSDVSFADIPDRERRQVELMANNPERKGLSTASFTN